MSIQSKVREMVKTIVLVVAIAHILLGVETEKKYLPAMKDSCTQNIKALCQVIRPINFVRWTFSHTFFSVIYTCSRLSELAQ